MKLPVVEHSTNINVGQEQLFTLSQDYDKRLLWDPFLKKIQAIDTGTTKKVGSQQWVKAHNGLTMVAQITSYTPPVSVSMKMIKGPFFFQIFTGVWYFHDLAPDETKVIFRYKFKTKWWSFRLISSKIVQFFLSRDIKKRLEGLKQYSERM